MNSYDNYTMLLDPGCHESIAVIKVGGSLFGLPDLAARLRFFVGKPIARRLLLVPGGGAAADGVRDLDRQHGLGEEASHWLALRALTMNAHFLHALLPELPVVGWPAPAGSGILDPHAFALADDAKPDHLPHSWDVTSDALAARAAGLLGADLVLLKSVDVSAAKSWDEATRAGIVDAYFAKALIPGTQVRVVNLRSMSMP